MRGFITRVNSIILQSGVEEESFEIIPEKVRESIKVEEILSVQDVMRIHQE